MNHKKQVIPLLLVMFLCLFGVLPSVKKEQQEFVLNQILQESNLNPDGGDPDEGWSFLRFKFHTKPKDTLDSPLPNWKYNDILAQFKQ